MSTKFRGYSLIECLVALSILGVFFGLLLPAVQQVRSSAGKAACQNNCRQIGYALHTYHDTHAKLPPYRFSSKVFNSPESVLSWMALILPYLEQRGVYESATNASMVQPDATLSPPHTGFILPMKSYICPADGRLDASRSDPTGRQAAYTSYIGIAGVKRPEDGKGFRGAIGNRPGLPFSAITDGLSNTIFVGERPPPNTYQAGWWYPAELGNAMFLLGPHNLIIVGGGLLTSNDPCIIVRGTFGPGELNNPCDRFHLWSLHLRGSNFLFGDGSVRFCTYNAEKFIIHAASIDGGEAIEIP